MSKTTLQEKKFNNIVREKVMEVMREILTDPDFGLDLSQETLLRLKKSVKAKEEGRVKNLSDVLKNYGY